MKKLWKALILTLLIILLALPVYGFAGDVSDYLILQDISGYKFMGEGGGKGSGLVAATGHFGEDHPDESYGALYFNETNEIGVKVEVTQHAGSDSDKWLLHEVERDFRNYYGLPGDSFVIRVIDGKTIMAAGSGGWAYRWLTSNKVIHIEYTDLQMTKPEPLEIVSAYLAKHPSTLTPITSADLRTDGNKTTWIKDEMDRRLWLGDKWIARIETVGNLNELSSVVKSLNVFLDYKEKYYGISAENEKQTLSEYLLAKNKAGIKIKLEEYKTWWAANKDKPITL